MSPKKKGQNANPNARPGKAKQYLLEKCSSLPVAVSDFLKGHVLFLYLGSCECSCAMTVKRINLLQSTSEEPESDVDKKVQAEAHVRGVLTRQSLQNLRRQFEETCCEIENKSLNIDWQRESVCLPIITRYRKRPAKSVSQKTESIPETHSVEIQTDFIDKISKPDETESDIFKKDYPAGTGSDLVINDSNSPRYLEKNTFEQTDVKIDKSLQIYKEENLDCIPVKETLLTDEQSSSAYETENCLSNVAGKNQQPNVSCVGDMTSVWETQNSSYHLNTEEPLPTNQTELIELRKNLAMELLWIQQAIQSRKNYLQIKDEMV